MKRPLALHSSVLAAALLLAAGAGAQTVPTAAAGDDQTIPCAPMSGAEVTLDGTGSTDPDPGAVLHYVWTGDALVGMTVEGATPTVTLPPGVHVLTLTVDDGPGGDGMSSDDVQITVVADTEPPQLVLAMESAELWPPNHKQHAFDTADLVASVSDTCDTEMTEADVVFARGTSDEADNGNGDGNTTGDIVLDCGMALVRAERAGPGDGRVYELTLEARDAAGNATERVFTVSVPHDKAHSPVDSGDVFEVLGACVPLDLCPPTPAETCDEAPVADVQIKERGKHGASLRWRAKGFSAAAADEGTDYQLCVYTESGGTATLEDDPAAPHGRGWKHHKKGASFRGQKAGHAARLDGLKLGEKKGAGALSASVGGDDASLPELPLAAGASLTLQLHDSEEHCVESEFSDPDVNDADHFEDEVGGN